MPATVKLIGPFSGAIRRATETVNMPQRSISIAHFSKPGAAHQFVDLGRGAPPHDPALSLPIAQDARDEFQLRMPGLIGVNQVAARLDRIGQSA